MQEVGVSHTDSGPACLLSPPVATSDVTAATSNTGTMSPVLSHDSQPHSGAPYSLSGASARRCPCL